MENEVTQIPESFAGLVPAQNILNVLAIKREDWAERSFPFYRKAWEEGAEMLVHLDDYWWKKGNVDEEQLFLECIDIVHFISSAYITFYRGDLERAAQSFDTIMRGEDAWQTRHSVHVVDSNGFRDSYIEAVERMIYHLIKHGDMLRFENLGDQNTRYLDLATTDLIHLVAGLGRNAADVLHTYAQKFALNVFRQHHGYREGTYIKLWDGVQEDNVFIPELFADLKGLDFTSTVEQGYERIADRYAGVFAQDRAHYKTKWTANLRPILDQLRAAE